MPYKFNSKELDDETGYYYYGARYYNPRTSIWLNVDPAFEEYPSWSPYSYTFNNPIVYTDPDGRALRPPAYYMNSRGFFMEGNSSWGEYMGNVRPGDNYHHLLSIRGGIYHNLNSPERKLSNKVNAFFGGDRDFAVEKLPYSLEHEINADNLQEFGAMAVTGVVLGKIGGFAGQLLKGAGNSLWKITALQRGFVYEEMLGLKGTFNVSNFPVIDAFYQGVATSIKTMDLGAKTYLKGNTVYNQLSKYIDALAGFNGQKWAGTTIKGSDITSKVLEVGIPKGATSSQVQQINKAIEVAASKNIQMNVRVVK